MSLEKYFAKQLATHPDNVGYKIYNNNILSTKTSALEGMFPMICALLGRDFFMQSARKYAKNYPSLSSDLNVYGKGFPDFISKYPSCDSFLYLRDLGVYEYKMNMLFYQRDDPTLSLGEISDGEVADKLSSQAQYFHSPYPIDNIVTFLKDPQSPPPEIKTGNYHYLLYRDFNDFEVYTLSLCIKKANILKQILDAGLTSLCSAALEDPEIISFVTFLMQKHLYLKP